MEKNNVYHLCLSMHFQTLKAQNDVITDIFAISLEQRSVTLKENLLFCQ